MMYIYIHIRFVYNESMCIVKSKAGLYCVFYEEEGANEKGLVNYDQLIAFLQERHYLSGVPNVCVRVCGYPLDDVLASDRLRLTGWLTDWLRS